MINLANKISAAALSLGLLLAGAGLAEADIWTRETIFPTCLLKANGRCVVSVTVPCEAGPGSHKELVVRPRCGADCHRVRRIIVRVVHNRSCTHPARVRVEPLRPHPRVLVRHLYVGQQRHAQPLEPDQPPPDWQRPTRPQAPRWPEPPEEFEQPWPPRKPDPIRPEPWEPISGPGRIE